MFGGLVAPQSIAVALDYGHGAQPACVGYIPGSHLIFGRQEWWFYGCPVRPGDKLFQERQLEAAPNWERADLAARALKSSA